MWRLKSQPNRYLKKFYGRLKKMQQKGLSHSILEQGLCDIQFELESRGKYPFRRFKPKITGRCSVGSEPRIPVLIQEYQRKLAA